MGICPEDPSPGTFYKQRPPPPGQGRHLNKGENGRGKKAGSHAAARIRRRKKVLPARRKSGEGMSGKAMEVLSRLRGGSLFCLAPYLHHFRYHLAAIERPAAFSGLHHLPHQLSAGHTFAAALKSLLGPFSFLSHLCFPSFLRGPCPRSLLPCSEDE
jgi:hypothetical protein